MGKDGGTITAAGMAVFRRKLVRVWHNRDEVEYLVLENPQVLFEDGALAAS